MNLNFTTTRHNFQLKIDEDLQSYKKIAVIGPNGCGKTTLLRSIIGLEAAVGSITIEGNKWLDSATGTHVPVRKRGIGYVAQTPKLFPHMSVYQNLKFAHMQALKRNGDQKLIEHDLNKIVEVFELSNLLNKKSQSLSGGEIARVALARSVIGKPRLLVLDELFTGIDNKRKSRLISYLHDYVTKHSIPMFLVTHDRNEAKQLCDFGLVLANGEVSARQEMSEVGWNSSGEHQLPAHNIVTAKFVRYDPVNQIVHCTLGDQSLLVNSTKQPDSTDEIRLRIFDRDVVLTKSNIHNTSAENILRGIIETIEPCDTANHFKIQLRVSTGLLSTVLSQQKLNVLEVTPNQQIFALITRVELLPSKFT